SIHCDRHIHRVDLGAGIVVSARTVVIATGVRYRKPDIPNLSRFEGVGIYYGATPVEALLCQDEDVIVVGGANSAGQAPVFLSEAKRRGLMLIPGASLSHPPPPYPLPPPQQPPPP